MARAVSSALLSVVLLVAVAQQAGATCREPNVVMWPLPRAAMAAGPAIITWYDHAFFQIKTSAGTVILTDPYLPRPVENFDPEAHIVTVGSENIYHNNVSLVRGSPTILRGVKPGGREWNRIETSIRDVKVYSIPTYHIDRGMGDKSSAFFFELDDLCIAHLSDTTNELAEKELGLIRQADILMIPIGGTGWSYDPTTSRKIVARLKPKIVIPMHYFGDREMALSIFIAGEKRVRRIAGNRLVVSRETLPPETTIYILTP